MHWFRVLVAQFMLAKSRRHSLKAFWWMKASRNFLLSGKLSGRE